MKDKKDKGIYIKCTEEEKMQIRENALRIGTTNVSNYARKMLLDGKVIKLDLGVLKDYVYEIGKIGTNINQIARNANKYNYTSQENINMIINNQIEIKKVTEKLVQVLEKNLSNDYGKNTKNRK